MLIVTFTVAGFHKLNYDFLNPDVSCIRKLPRSVQMDVDGAFVP